MTDADGDPKAIAITGADRTNGTWDYSTNGGTSWTTIASTSDSNATLLGATSFYTATLGTAPSAQSWLSYTALNIPVSGTPTPAINTETTSTAGALVDTTTNQRIYAGYSNYNTSNALVNANSPTLSNTQGYSISFDLQVLADSNTNTSRAGFSVLLVSQDTTQAIEIGFQRLSATTGNIFAQNASFVAAESIAYDTNIKTDYRVEVLGTTYKLFANNSQILTGNLRNYNFTPPANFPFNPYTKSNLVFLGDDTTSAQGSFNLNQVVVQTDNRIRFVPNANYNGSANISFRAWDTTDGKAAGAIANTSINGGTTAFSSAVETATITISAVNDAPAGTDKTISLLEDATYTLTTADFGFSDTNDTPANSLSAVKISTLASAGTLKLNNVAVAANAIISTADITANKLTFTPATNSNGTNYANFTFQVQDNGGTANNGIDLDQSANTITVDVTAVNDAPTLSTTGLTPTFTEAAGANTQANAVLLFSSTATSTIEAGQTIKSLTLDISGLRDGDNETLSINGQTIVLGTAGSTTIGTTTYSRTTGINKTTVMISDSSGFTPTAIDTIINGIAYQNTNKDNPTAGDRTITITAVQDSGGTASGGQDISILNLSSTVTVIAINDAPAVSISNITSVTENVAGAVIATISTSDSENNAITYSIKVNGVLDDRFEIVAGKLKLKSTVSLDYEAAASLNLEVIATDDGTPSRSASSLFTLGINDVKEKPVIQNLPDTMIQAISGQAIVPIRFLVSDSEQGNPDSLKITFRSQNQTLIPARNIRIFGSGTERFLSFTPSMLSGTSQITVIVRATNGEITEQAITIQVTPPRRNGFIKRLMTIRTGI
jgi:hypothetical protein